MNLEKAKLKLIEVLQEIQNDSGYGGTQILGTTCPLNDLEGFDSKIAPFAIGMLAVALDVNIPVDKNIFVSENGKRQLTIDESAAVVCEIVSRGEN
jgi:hypothetical protein